MSSEFVDLPFAIQVALGSGYAAYLIAFSGIRQHHTPTDIIFRTIAFGLVASAMMKASPTLGLDDITAATLAFLSTVVAAGLWRALIGPLAKKIIRMLLISWADDLPSAWLSITAERTDLRPSQIVVELVDGRLLMCDDTRSFADAPFEVGVFVLDGSIAMYVTSEKPPGGNWTENEDVLHGHEGANISYIAPANIKRVDLRHWSAPKRNLLPRWFRRWSRRLRRR